MKINILHIRSSSGLYGAEGVILNLAQFTDRDQYEVKIICLGRSDEERIELVERAKSLGIKAESVSYQGFFDKNSFRKIREMIISENINIIHTHGYKSDILGWMLSMGTAAKHVITNHSWTKTTWKLALYEFLDGIVFNFADAIVAVSEQGRKDSLRFCFNKRKVQLIENGIDIKKFSKSENTFEDKRVIRRELGLQESSILIGCVSRLSPEKNLKALIAAFSEIDAGLNRLKYELIIVGDGPQKKELQGFVRTLGKEKKVHFLGFQAGIERIYYVMDQFVLPSFREGLPLTLLEAILMEVPVVASDVGGISSIIRNEETGYLIDPKNIKALTEQIIKCAENRTLTLKCVKAAKKIVEETCSISSMTRKYQRLYKNC